MVRLLPVLVWLLLVAAPAGAAELSALRDHALELVNASRAEQGLAPLDLAEPLNEAAQAHAEDMLERAYYSHVSPGGETIMDRYLQAGGTRAKQVAENIARCAGCTPPVRSSRITRLHTGWMDSEGHRENILDPGHTQFGFGVAAAEGDGLYAVQTFAGPGETTGTAIDPARRLEVALETINAARRDAGVPPLQAAPEVSESLRRAVPDDGLASFDMKDLGHPLELLPADRPTQWRSFSLVAGQCGGCGADPTAADVRRFIDQWLNNAQYRETLTKAAFSHLAFTLAADGSGRKVAVALLVGG